MDNPGDAGKVLDRFGARGARCPSPGRTERHEHRAGSPRRSPPACWRKPPGVGSVVESSPAAGWVRTPASGAFGWRVRDPGPGRQSGARVFGPGHRAGAQPATRHHGPRVEAQESRHRPPLGTTTFGSRRRRAGTARHSAPTPLGAGTEGQARRPLGTAALGQRRRRAGNPPVARHEGPRVHGHGGQAPVGPEERARETSSVTRGHHRFWPPAHVAVAGRWHSTSPRASRQDAVIGLLPPGHEEPPCLPRSPTATDSALLRW